MSRLLIYKTILYRCPLFAGLTDAQLEYALRFFSAEIRRHDKGDFLNRPGFPLPAFGLLLDGNVQVYMVDIDGQEMIMANVSAGDTFGESLWYLRLDAPVYIRALSACEVLWLNPETIRSQNAAWNALDAQLSGRFTAMLARRTLSMNDRIQILSKSTLRQKLIAFFSQCTQHSGKESFTVPFNRSDMAAYLGTERSALSRELSRMQKEGIIDFHKNHFHILINFHE